MRQETIIKTILTFDELTKEQQSKVCDRFRDINTGHDWWDYIYEEYTKLLTELGFHKIVINFSGFCSQGDGASFSADWNHAKCNKESIEEFNKDYVGLFSEEAQTNFKHVLDDTKFIQDCMDSGKHVHNDYNLDEDFNVERINTHYCHEGTISAQHSSMRIFARQLSAEIYKSLEKEYYYLQSDESIKETIECNDYEFNQDTLELE